MEARGRGSGRGGRGGRVRGRGGGGKGNAGNGQQRRGDDLSASFAKLGVTTYDAPLKSTVPRSAHYVDIFCGGCGRNLVRSTNIHRINDGNVWTNMPEKHNLDIHEHCYRNNAKTIEMIEIGDPWIIYIQDILCAGCKTKVGTFMDHHLCIQTHDPVYYKFFHSTIQENGEDVAIQWQGEPEYHMLSHDTLPPKTKVEEAVLRFLVKEGSISARDIDKMQLRTDGLIGSATYIPLSVFGGNLKGENAKAEKFLKIREKGERAIRGVFMMENNLKISPKWMESPRFQFLLQVLEKYTNANSKYKEFKDDFKRFNRKFDVIAYRNKCNLVHDILFEQIKSSPGYNYAKNTPVVKLAAEISRKLGQTPIPTPPAQMIRRDELYQEKYNNCDFVSIDLKSANFNTLRLLGLFNVPSWAKLVASIAEAGVSENSIIAKSKKLRVRVLGKFFHEKIRALEFHIVRLISFCFYLKILFDQTNIAVAISPSLRKAGYCADLFCFSCDELLIKLKKGSNAANNCANLVRKAIQAYIPDLSPICTVSAFSLTSLQYTEEMKRDLDEFLKTQQDNPGIPKDPMYDTEEGEVEAEWRVDDSNLPVKSDYIFFVKRNLLDDSSDPPYAFKHVPMCVATLAHFFFHSTSGSTR